MHFQFSLGSDPASQVATLYGSQASNPARPYFRRTIFVIGKDGKVVYSKPSFNVNAQTAYDDLAAAVASAKK
jgi:peroxiredoxin